MKKLNILVYGKHPGILQTVLRLINREVTWFGAGSTNENELLELFEKNDFDLVLLGGGVPLESEEKIRYIFQAKNPGLKIVQHYGGGSGLLKSEIETAFA